MAGAQSSFGKPPNSQCRFGILLYSQELEIMLLQKWDRLSCRDTLRMCGRERCVCDIIDQATPA